MRASSSLFMIALAQLLLPSFSFHIGALHPATKWRGSTLANACARGRRLRLRTSMALDQGKVATFLQKGEEAVSSSDPKKLKKTPLTKAMAKATKSISVALEASLRMPISSTDLREEYCVKGLKGFSQAMRATSVNGIWVRLQEGGKDLDTLQAFCEEQAGAAGDFPGPVGVVRDGVSTFQEAAEAAAAGCTAISFDLPLSSVDPKELVAAATGMSMETIAAVSSSDQIDAALQTGASMVCMVVDQSVNIEQMKELRGKLPKGVPGLVKIKSKPEDYEGIVLGRNLQKDAGWTGVIWCGALTGGKEDLDNMPIIVAEATSKKSDKVNLNFMGANRGAVSSSPTDPPPSASPWDDALPSADTPKARPKPAAPRFNRQMKGKVGGDMIGLDEWMNDD